MDDLMVNLFEGYAAASDAAFVRYIQDQEDCYMLQGDSLTYTQLMQLALNKFTLLSDKCQWGQASDEKKQLLALTSEIDSLKERNKKLDSIVSKATKLATSKSLKRSNPKKTVQKSTKRRKYTPKPLAEKDKWKKIPPKDGEPTTKVVECRTYHWCTKHQMWCMHTSEECRYDPESGTVAAAANVATKDSNKENEENNSTLLQQFLLSIDEENKQDEE